MELSPTQEIVRFGLFELDAKAAHLTRNGFHIRLPQQPLRLLSILLERPGEIVTREQLRERLWPSDVFIDFDHGLNKSIQKLRDALGDSAESPRYIETIPRLGYRFIAPVSRRAFERHERVSAEVPEILPRDVVAPARRAASSEGSGGKRPAFVVGGTAGLLAVCAAAGIALYVSSRTHLAVRKYAQLTDFTDSATTPALSPDGRMLAFIRGEGSLMAKGEIYVKMLPDGEARPLTHDPRSKYGLTFSLDGSEIAYTVMDPPGFSTYTISVLGGDSHLLLRNAAGLTWLNANELLFSRIHSGLHMGVVRSNLSGDNVRELYFPAHERGMAHYSAASPDRRWALVAEMNGQGDWYRCRLISLEDVAEPKNVGPKGGCTEAGWSPDGSWMYFVATVDAQSHIWRQRYPDGRPEMINMGPSEEEGLAVAPDGRSIITSVGTYERAIWIHDAAGDRSLSSEGEVVAGASPPSFGPEDKTIYYLLRHRTADASTELWRLTLDTGKAEAVFPRTPIDTYNVSPDGKQVVYANVGRDGKSQLWLAPTDRSLPARRIGHSGEITPYFGPQGKILFQTAEGNLNYLEQMNQDGTGRSKALPYPIIEIQGISPTRKWLMAVAAYPSGNRLIAKVVAIPMGGGSPRQLCPGYCRAAWSSNGRFLFIPVEDPSETSPGRSLAIPVGPGEDLANLPAEGIPPNSAPSVVPGARSVNGNEIVPGANLSHYAYVNTTVHRNLFRISLP
ncbi:MAG: winged helix-turn-helix domain-containing protein [Acidobacteriaceae bacterium]